MGSENRTVIFDNGPQLFNVGTVTITPGADAVLEAHGQPWSQLVARHASGDWGDVSSKVQADNDRAVENGGRILSSYRLSMGNTIWILTEADRTASMVMLPDARIHRQRRGMAGGE